MQALSGRNQLSDFPGRLARKSRDVKNRAGDFHQPLLSVSIPAGPRGSMQGILLRRFTGARDLSRPSELSALFFDTTVLLPVVFPVLAREKKCTPNSTTLIWCVGDFGVIVWLQTLAKLTTGQRRKLRANRYMSSGCSERGGAGGVAK